jgi:TRAP-type C4-dicarboxylate transport system permease large subunit
LVGFSPMGVLVMMVGLIIVIMFPQIALWLPNLYFGT